MSSFSVAKKVTEDDISKFFTIQKKTGKTNSQIEKMLKSKIMDEIQDAVTHNKIPGLISPQEIAKEAGFDKHIVDNMPELNKLIMVIAHKLSEKPYDKQSLCYFINSLVNMLGLEEEDFDNFHKQNNTDEDDDDEDDDDGEESNK
jgi:hypothetical protein